MTTTATQYHPTPTTIWDDLDTAARTLRGEVYAAGGVTIRRPDLVALWTEARALDARRSDLGWRHVHPTGVR